MQNIRPAVSKAKNNYYDVNFYYETFFLNMNNYYNNTISKKKKINIKYITNSSGSKLMFLFITCDELSLLIF